MAQKAIILAPTNLQNPSGNTWEITVSAFVSDTGGGGTTISATATSNTFTPLLGWRPLIGDAVKAAALAQLSVAVDNVLFPDFGILGV